MTRNIQAGSVFKTDWSRLAEKVSVSTNYADKILETGFGVFLFCFCVCVLFFFFSNLTLNLNKALCSIGMGSSQCVSAGGEVELPAMEITPVEHCNKFEDCYG